MSEDQKIISSLKKSRIPWYVADVSSTKGDREATLKILTKINKAVPDTVVMAMSAFIENLCIAVNPSPKSEVWLKTAISMFPSDAQISTTPEGTLFVVIEKNLEKGFFPIQMMETARANAFAFLKAHGLIKDEDSDDDDAMLAMDENEF